MPREEATRAPAIAIHVIDRESETQSPTSASSTTSRAGGQSGNPAGLPDCPAGQTEKKIAATHDVSPPRGSYGSFRVNLGIHAKDRVEGSSPSRLARHSDEQ